MALFWQFSRSVACGSVLALLAIGNHAAIAQSTDAQGSGPDVIGIRIGMSPQPVLGIMKQRDFGTGGSLPTKMDRATLVYRNAAGAELPIKGADYVSYVSGNTKDQFVQVHFAPVPGRDNAVVALRREVRFEIERDRPLFGSVVRALAEKYGRAVALKKESPANLLWSFDKNGSPQKFGGEPTPCANLAHAFSTNASWVMYTVQGWRTFEDAMSRCGSSFLAVDLQFVGGKFQGADTLISRQVTLLIGMDASYSSLKTAHAIIQKAEGAGKSAEIERARQRKPDL